MPLRRGSGNAHKKGSAGVDFVRSCGAHLKRFEKLEIYLSASINIALHGEPSTPDKFSGAAFKK